VGVITPTTADFINTPSLAFFSEPFGYSFEALLISEKNKSVDREASEIEFS